MDEFNSCARNGNLNRRRAPRSIFASARCDFARTFSQRANATSDYCDGIREAFTRKRTGLALEQTDCSNGIKYQVDNSPLQTFTTGKEGLFLKVISSALGRSIQ